MIGCTLPLQSGSPRAADYALTFTNPRNFYKFRGFTFLGEIAIIPLLTGARAVT